MIQTLFLLTLVTGAGATFPYPIYSKWFSDYGKAHPDARFNYQSIGSGAGVKQITERTIDFGASDAPMTDEELKRAPGILQIPTVLGAVAVVYNGMPAGIHLDGELVADIFLGRIAKWNDARIAQLNPGFPLVDKTIVVVHRSDGSGTTAVFTEYLAKQSAAWKSSVGAAKSVRWPSGIGGKGNEGVTALVKNTPGAIGYVELAYAKQNKLSMAAVKNAAGSFVAPSVETVSNESYAISALTYLLVYRDQSDAAKGTALAQFLWWAIHEGQASAASLDYAPLPKALLPKVEAMVKSITVGGKSVIAPK